MKLFKIVRIFLVIISCLTLTIINVNGQDDDSSISAELKKKRDEAIARKEIAEARKAELDALVSIPDADSLRGSTEFKELKGEFLETRILGYKAMSKAVLEIACDSRSEVGKNATLIVYKPEDAARIQKYRSMIGKQKQMLSFYREVVEEADQLRQITKQDLDTSTLGGNPALAALSIVGDLVGLFQRKESYSPTTFDIAEKELIAVFFEQFRNAACSADTKDKGVPNLYYPGSMPIFVSGVENETSAMWINVLNLDVKRKEAEAKINQLDAVKQVWEQEIVSVTTQKNRQEFTSKADSLRFRVDTLREFYKGYLKELGIPFKDESQTKDKPPPKPDSNTPTMNVNVYNQDAEKKENKAESSSSFFDYLEAEKLYKLMTLNENGGKGYWIQLAVTKAGGNVRVVSIPIVDIFVGNRVRFSGGAIVTYNIFDIDGRSKLSGVAHAYEKYQGANKIK